MGNSTKSRFGSNGIGFRGQNLGKKVLNNADLVLTTIGGDLKKQLQLKAPNQDFAIVPNGYDDVLIKKIKSEKSKKYFHIVRKKFQMKIPSYLFCNHYPPSYQCSYFVYLWLNLYLNS